jgi:hypothetical protein
MHSWVRSYGSTFSFSNDVPTPSKTSIQSAHGLRLHGNSSAWVYGFPASGGSDKGGGRLYINLTMEAGSTAGSTSAVIIAVTDHFSDPDDAIR